MTTSDLVKVDSAGMPGEYNRCTRCSEVGEVGAMVAHVCHVEPPKISEEQAQDQADELMLKELENRWLNWAALSPQERGDAPDRATAIHRWEKHVKFTWDNRLRRVEVAFTPGILHKLVTEEKDFLLRRTREMRDGEVSLNDERRAKGISYAKRMEMLNKSKIDWCDQQESKLMRSFRVRPLREWFDEADYWMAKLLGMRWVVRTKLEMIMD